MADGDDGDEDADDMGEWVLQRDPAVLLRVVLLLSMSSSFKVAQHTLQHHRTGCAVCCSRPAVFALSLGGASDAALFAVWLCSCCCCVWLLEGAQHLAGRCR
jgi:formate dehydrogenase maturation protein FdhE